MNRTPTDIVLPWVDGNDPAWRAEKNKYDRDNRVSDVRYEPWDNLQYVFRGIEKYMPWVGRVFFVTWGHVPEWLDTSCGRLTVVRHDEYIPMEYLPTFNSNVIEMNCFRIKELSENFILFNDDLFPVQPIPEEYYFQDGLPCGEAVETHFILKAEKGMDMQMNYACVNNMVLLNRNFDKRAVLETNRDKWFSPIYGERLQQNINLEFWNNFESFVYPHEAAPMKKSVMREIWEREPEALDMASRNRSRSYSDVTQRLVAMWQMCSGNFVPHKYRGKMFLVDDGTYKEAAAAVREQKYPVISLNETGSGDFETIKAEINMELGRLFPDKSEFEI